MSVLKRLSDKISEVYDLELQEELTEIFEGVVSEYEELIDAYEKKTIRLKIWKEYSDVGQRMYHEKCDELDKVLEEKEKVEYDRDYFEKYSKELVDEINKM